MEKWHTIWGRVVLLVTAGVSFSAVYVSYTSGYMLAYNDATAHLNTARRMVDSLTPGLVQIGSVWLPLLHLFELPFAYNFFLWNSGLAGAIVSSGSFILSSFFLYRLILYITKNITGALLGVLVFITNLNILYLQTTAMFEPLLMATALGAVYFLTKWAVEYSLRDLIIAAFFTMLATLTRYDGWALFLAFSFFVMVISLIKKRKGGEGSIIIFMFLGVFGIFLWLLYNKLIFSDPLYFARSEYSAAAQQQILFDRGQLSSKGNISHAFLTYSLSTIFNLGVLTTVGMVLGIFVYLFNNIFKVNRWAPLLLLIPFGFNVVSLFLGQSVIWLPMMPPYFETYFNARYGLLMLPTAAFFIGFLATKHWVLKIVALGLIVGQIILFLNPAILPLYNRQIGIITLQDTVSSVNAQTLAASKFLHDHHTNGLIMISSASADAFIFRAGLPLKNYITEGTGKYWKESLDNPGKYATWLVFFKDRSDRVGIKVGDPKKLDLEFKKVYEDQTYQIWQKKL